MPPEFLWLKLDPSFPLLPYYSEESEEAILASDFLEAFLNSAGRERIDFTSYPLILSWDNSEYLLLNFLPDKLRLWNLEERIFFSSIPFPSLTEPEKIEFLMKRLRIFFSQKAQEEISVFFEPYPYPSKDPEKVRLDSNPSIFSFKSTLEMCVFVSTPDTGRIGPIPEQITITAMPDPFFVLSKEIFSLPLIGANFYSGQNSKEIERLFLPLFNSEWLSLNHAEITSLSIPRLEYFNQSLFFSSQAERIGTVIEFGSIFASFKKGSELASFLAPEPDLGDPDLCRYVSGRVGKKAVFKIGLVSTQVRIGRSAKLFGSLYRGKAKEQ